MTPLLSLEAVSKSFWRGTVRIEVLRRVSLQLEAGDFVTISGRLGTGKTTLLRVAAGLEPPDEGEVRFRGRRVADMTRRHVQLLRRQRIGFVDRSGPYEQGLRTLDHVAFPLMGAMRRADASRRAMETMRRLGLEPACGALRWAELTDGERTLVSIAHAVVRQPELLLVDDPTSNLGFHERERTFALLHRLASDRRMAVLIAAPDGAATTGARRLLTLGGGELRPVASAAGGDLIRLPGA